MLHPAVSLVTKKMHYFANFHKSNVLKGYLYSFPLVLSDTQRHTTHTPTQTALQGQ